MIQYLLLLIVTYTGAALSLPTFLRFLDAAGMHRPNYAGHETTLGAGLLLVLLLPLYSALAILAGVPALPVPLTLVFVFAVTGFGLAGLVDDCLATPGDKGFRGHFTALLREGRLTSGALKALAGGTVALLASLALAALLPKPFGAWYQVILNLILIASAANVVNLFDLRPGRAGKVFFLGVGICAALAAKIDLYGAPVLLVVAAYIPLFRRDLRAQLMLGDTGANFLGATLGMAMVLLLTWYAKLAAVVILLGLQALSERCSFGSLIERVALLRIFDRWGRGKQE